MPRVVIAIDPGRSKCGLAIVSEDGAVLHRSVVATDRLCASLREMAAGHSPEAVLIGDGTGAGPVIAAAEALGLPAPLISVDERHTSELARARYMSEVPARGMRRLLPRSLRAPEAAYDDFVAVILAERWWSAEGVKARAGED